ncbi:MAG: TfoX/Sxy family protein [Pseudomonadota bacterium]
MASDFLDYLSEVLRPLGSVRGTRMFGGTGVYVDGLFCALIIDEVLYFKGDDENEAAFKAAACAPFTYEKKGGVCSIRYYRVPDEALDDPVQMMQWARLGLGAALRKGAGEGAKRTKPKTPKAGAPTRARPTRLAPRSAADLSASMPDAGDDAVVDVRKGRPKP